MSVALLKQHYKWHFIPIVTLCVRLASVLAYVCKCKVEIVAIYFVNGCCIADGISRSVFAYFFLF